MSRKEMKSHKEIAEELNLSVKSINRYKQKTMDMLRKEFKEYLPVLLYLIVVQKEMQSII